MEQININLQSPWSIRNGKAICPVVMIREGVLNGSKGPIFWPGHILQQNAAKWNNIPVSIGHPQVNGGAVSINYNQMNYSYLSASTGFLVAAL